MSMSARFSNRVPRGAVLHASKFRIALSACVLAASLFVLTACAGTPTVVHKVTRHTGTFGGQTVSYRAVVENYRVQPQDAGPVDLVSTSYLADCDSAASRPVLFAFNGGPIAPSMYLHLMALGPRRVIVPEDLHARPSQLPLVDNTASILDVADLVFYDPAGTGYSRFAEGTDPKAYFGNVGDAREFVAFMHAWLERHGRADSPLYVLGESYGTMRAAEVARQLSEESPQLPLRGLFLMGQALNLTETAQRPGNIISYTASLPTLAALGWYHGKVERNGRSLEQLLDQVREFAAGAYLQALFQGAALPAAKRAQVAEQLHALTGLDAQVYLKHELRVSKNLFRSELLKEQGLVLGANDGRYTAKPDKPGALPDASMAVLVPLNAAYQQFASRWLGVPSGATYVTQSPITDLESWDWGSKAGPFGNWPYDASVREAMQRLPELKVVLGAGHYDTLTTTGATEYLLAQAGWPADRVTLVTYPGGHMSYTVTENLHQFGADLRTMLDATASP